MEITRVTIAPVPVKNRQGKEIAKGQATFEDSIIAFFTIYEGRKGIYACWHGIRFIDETAKKQACNRVLATYVLNYCVDA